MDQLTSSGVTVLLSMSGAILSSCSVRLVSSEGRVVEMLAALERISVGDCSWEILLGRDGVYNHWLRHQGTSYSKITLRDRHERC